MKFIEGGKIDFAPIREANKRARAKGVPQAEIERATDQFLADARAAILREDDRLEWVMLAGIGDEKSV